MSVQVSKGEPLTAILEFEMPRVAQYKVVDQIDAEVKFWTWQFCEDITIRFPKR